MRVKKFLATALAVIMVVTIAPSVAVGTASAASVNDSTFETASDKTATDIVTGEKDNKKYIEKMTISPYTYYDVGDGASKNCDDAMIRKVVSDKLLKDYACIANGLWENEDDDGAAYYTSYAVDDGDYKSNFDTDNPRLDCFGKVIEYLSSDVSKSKGSVCDDNLYSTGLCMANSLSDVRDALCETIASRVGRKTLTAEKLKKRGKTEEEGTLPEMNDDKESTAAYNIVTSVKKSGNKFVYNSFGICFYDFQLTPIEADGLTYHTAADGYSSVQEAYEKGDVEGITINKDSGQISQVTVDNTSNKEINETVTSSTEETTSSTTEFSRETGTTFSHSVGTNVQFGTDEKPLLGILGTVSLSYDFTTETSTFKTTTTSATKESTSSVSTDTNVELPPYSAVVVQHKTNTGSFTTPFDTPAQLSYKVAVFSMNGDVYADKGLICAFRTAGYEQGYYFNNIGNRCADERDSAPNENLYKMSAEEAQREGISANENLYRRTFKNPEVSRSDSNSAVVHKWYDRAAGRDFDKKNASTDWSKFKEGDAAYEALKNQRTNIPMISSGGTTSMKGTIKKTEVLGMKPLYNLSEVCIVKDEKSFNTRTYSMVEGDKINIDGNIELRGYNNQKGEYFEFDESDGAWEICDKDGNISQNANVSIENDKDGTTILKAKQAGKAYITWRLNEGEEYTCCRDDSVVDRNSDIKWPIVEIDISKEAFKGTVKIDGDFDGCVGDEDLNLNDSLSVTVLNERDVEVEQPYIWEQKELARKGIQVSENGDVKFTQAGTYHVRAIIKNTESEGDDVVSEWYEITAKPERELTKIEFSDNAEEKKQISGMEGSEVNCDMSSYLQGYDQYGRKIDKDLGNLSYFVNATSKNPIKTSANMKGDVLNVTEPGTYEVTAETAKGKTDTCTVVVDDNTDIEKEELSMSCGEKGQIIVRDFDNNVVEDGVKFEAEDNGVLSVSEDGIVEAMKVGTSKVTATGPDESIDSCTITVTRGTQKLSVKCKTKKTIAIKHLKKQSVSTCPMSVTGNRTAVTYKKMSGSSRIKVNSKTGTVTVKKGTKKGTYKIKIKTSAKATTDFAGNSVTKPFKVIVK